MKKGWSWNTQKVKMIEFKLYFQDKVTVDLRNYILRYSKSSEKKAIVLESTKKVEIEHVKFCFKSEEEHERYFPILARRV